MCPHTAINVSSGISGIDRGLLASPSPASLPSLAASRVALRSAHLSLSLSVSLPVCLCFFLRVCACGTQAQMIGGSCCGCTVSAYCCDSSVLILLLLICPHTAALLICPYTAACGTQAQMTGGCWYGTWGSPRMRKRTR